MRAIVYRQNGDSSVMHVEELPDPVAGEGEVLVRVVVSGINPTDWKQRVGGGRASGIDDHQIPDQDGAGIVVAVGPGVSDRAVGDRVWLWDCAWQRRGGTAAELVALPARQVVRLPSAASFDVGASLGIPALTAHRALTVGPNAPTELSPGALADRVVLVAGGAGAVGHAAIQLAVWAGATVIATASTPEKQRLSALAGAHHVIDYRAADAAQRIRSIAPQGVAAIVEVNPETNAILDAEAAASGATIAFYAGTADALRSALGDRDDVTVEGVLTYTTPAEQKDAGVRAVSAAAAAGALPVGAQHGLPLTRFPFERTRDAHDAVEAGTVGKVLVDISAE